MTDIVARGRERATAYIEELKTENKRLRTDRESMSERGLELDAWCKQLQVENARLQATKAEMLARLRGALYHVESAGDDTLATMIREAIVKAERK